MGSYLYCPKCNEYLGSLGGDSCSCGWEQAPFEEPQQRTWVGLTDDEVINVMPDDDAPMSLGEAFSKFAQLIEDKLKQKNGYAEEKNT